MDPKLIREPPKSHTTETDSPDPGPSAPPSDLTWEEAQRALGTADPLDWEWGDDDIVVWTWQDATPNPVGRDGT